MDTINTPVTDTFQSDERMAEIMNTLVIREPAPVDGDEIEKIEYIQVPEDFEDTPVESPATVH